MNNEQAACQISVLSNTKDISIFQAAGKLGVTDEAIIARACAIANGAGPPKGADLVQCACGFTKVDPMLGRRPHSVSVCIGG
jgi:hypothetical protein